MGVSATVRLNVIILNQWFGFVKKSETRLLGVIWPSEHKHLHKAGPLDNASGEPLEKWKHGPWIMQARP